jgi:hypothetical protein
MSIADTLKVIDTFTISYINNNNISEGSAKVLNHSMSKKELVQRKNKDIKIIKNNKKNN